MHKPRNNITRLSLETRLRICQLLADGATYDEIRSDEEVIAECSEKNLTLHNSTFAAYRDGIEYDEYLKRAKGWREKMVRDSVAAALIKNGNGPESLADMADFELLKICVDKLQNGEELEPKELTSISRAVAGFQRNRLAADREDSKREFAEKEAAYQARIAELSAKVAELIEKVGPADNSKTIAEMDKFVKGE